MKTEVWKQIEGFEGRYSISSLGNVKSFVNSRGNVREKGKLRKPVLDKDGYLECMLRKDGKYFHKKVHSLVANAFLPNPDNLKEVNHLDGNKQNNEVSNLEWSTRVENEKHKNRVLKKYGGPIPPHEVICIETGVVFPSVSAAAESVGVKGETNISHAAKYGHKSGGVHWAYNDLGERW